MILPDGALKSLSMTPKAFLKYASQSAAAGLSLLIVLGMPAQASSIKPHRAFYAMELGRASQNANVQAINGRSAFTLSRDCDGWVSSEDYLIEFGSREGGRDRIMSRFESWESIKGDKYSFSVSEQSSYKAEQNFDGFATLGSDGGAALIAMESDVSVTLPAKTLFPMQHMAAILSHAEAGQKILAASVFTGAEPEDALLSTNTVIGGWNESGGNSTLGEMETLGFWPVRVAYFKPTAKSAEPEYEINYALQPNGIIRRYEIDYGDFTIIAKLLRLEPVSAPACK